MKIPHSSNYLDNAFKILVERFNPSGRCLAAESYFSKQKKAINFSPICKNKWGTGCNLKNGSKCTDCAFKKIVPVDEFVIKQHVNEQYRRGIYPALPGKMCQFIVIDVDGHNQWQHPEEDAKKIIRTAADLEMPVMVFISNSGAGYHVYVFFTEPVPYIKARAVIDFLIDRAGNLSSIDAIKPLHPCTDDTVSGGLIALPFNRSAFEQRKSTVPVDESLNPVADNFEDCIEYFQSEYSPMSVEELDAFIKEYSLDISERSAPPPPNPETLSKMAGQLSPCIQHIITENPRTERTNYNKLTMNVAKYLLGTGLSLEQGLSVCEKFISSYPYSKTYCTPELRREHFITIWKHIQSRTDSYFDCRFILGLKLGGKAFECKQCPLGKKENMDADIPIVNASEYLENEPPEPDQIIKDVFDMGDKLAVIASSKQRKSMFVCQMALALSSGKTSFFGWGIPKTRRVLLIQLEVKADHFHRRVRRISKALSIKSKDIADRLFIVNGRGLNLAGTDGVERIQRATETHSPDVVIIDPFYKLNDGIENAQQDMRSILSAFDNLVETTGAGLVYVHHDGKGAVGEKALTDRGSGSGVMGRDYDAAIILTKHSDVEEATVLETVLRNYPPKKPDVIMWKCNDEGDAYCFECDDTIAPEKQSGKQKVKPPPPSAYIPSAYKVLENREIDISIFKADFKDMTGLSDNRVREFITWGTAGDDPCLITRSERGRGINKKWLRFSEVHKPETGNINLDLSGV